MLPRQVPFTYLLRKIIHVVFKHCLNGRIINSSGCCRCHRKSYNIFNSPSIFTPRTLHSHSETSHLQISKQNTSGMCHPPSGRNGFNCRTNLFTHLVRWCCHSIGILLNVVLCILNPIPEQNPSVPGHATGSVRIDCFIQKQRSRKEQKFALNCNSTPCLVCSVSVGFWSARRRKNPWNLFH